MFKSGDGQFEKIWPWVPLKQEKESTLSRKVIHIPAYSDMTNEVAALTRLKKTWAGRFYNTVSIKNQFVRNAVNRIWRSLHSHFCRIYSLCLNGYEIHKWRPIVKQKIYAQREMIVIHKLLDSSTVKTPVPRVYPSHDQDYLRAPHDQYEFPEVVVSVINDAIINGGSNLILVNGAAICHDLYDFERDYTAEESHKKILISPKSGRIKWLFHDATPEKIPAAGVFVDALAPNYAHWLTEVLPRIAAFCADERFKRIPIVVNADLHPNIMSSLYAVSHHEREIISLPIGRALSVGEIYVTSTTGYVPYERRSIKLSGHSEGLFSPTAFALVRDIFINKAQKENDLPTKIFVRRKSAIRNVVNSDQIEMMLVKNGYVVVEPEKLCFYQQVQLFANAKIIVGSSGAAMANLIFASPKARVVILISKNENTSYWYWQNIACASSKNVLYVLGISIKRDNRGIHDDFWISPHDVSDAIA